MAKDSGPETPFPLKTFIETIGKNLFPSASTAGGFTGEESGSSGPILRGGGGRPGVPIGYSEAPGRATYKAYRLGTALFLNAAGTLSSISQIPALRASMIEIFPQQFDFVVYSPLASLPALRPFSITQRFGFPTEPASCVVHDADGRHDVAIEDVVAGLPDGTRSLLSVADAGGQEAVGYGTSIQDAFDHAVAQLPRQSDVADALFTYRMVESGMLIGGFPGFHDYFARVTLSAP